MWRTRWAVLVAVSAISVLGLAGVGAGATPRLIQHAVPLDCSNAGGDHRSAYDASVQPGVIVPNVTGFPVTYTAFGFNRQMNEALIMGNPQQTATTDHLVAAWWNSTDCAGNDDISRNAWIADSAGHVFGESNLTGPPADNFGDASGIHLNEPIVGMTPTSDGQGYWLVAADGGIFNYGDATFHGSTGNIRLNQAIVGMSVSPSGQGYTLVAMDGGVFSFGDAQFYGSLPGVLGPGRSLNKPIEGIVTTPDGGGYWMVASDGGVFTFGDAPFLGSLGGQKLAAPISGMFANGNGYTLVDQDGTLYPFG